MALPRWRSGSAADDGPAIYAAQPVRTSGGVLVSRCAPWSAHLLTGFTVREIVAVSRWPVPVRSPHAGAGSMGMTTPRRLIALALGLGIVTMVALLVGGRRFAPRQRRYEDCGAPAHRCGSDNGTGACDPIDAANGADGRGLLGGALSRPAQLAPISGGFNTVNLDHGVRGSARPTTDAPSRARI